MRTVILVGFMILASAVCMSQGVEMKIESYTARAISITFLFALASDVIDLFKNGK